VYEEEQYSWLKNTLKIMRATMLLSATSNGVGVNMRLVGYGLSISRYQGIYREGYQPITETVCPSYPQTMSGIGEDPLHPIGCH